MIYSNSATITTHGLHDSYHQPCGNGTEKCTIDFLLTYLDSISISTLIEYVVLQPSVLVSYTYTHTYIYIYTCYYYIYTHTGCMCLQYIWLVFHRLSSRSSVLPSCACPRWWHVGSDVTASRKEQQGSAGSESLELQKIPTNRGVQTCHSMKG